MNICEIYNERKNPSRSHPWAINVDHIRCSLLGTIIWWSNRVISFHNNKEQSKNVKHSMNINIFLTFNTRLSRVDGDIMICNVDIFSFVFK